MKIEQQVYTSCPQGKGYDGISGFQVKARSQGVTDSMSRAILRYSNHYRPPRNLRQLEYQEYQTGHELSPEVLKQFPVVVTYHVVEGNCYGLTRIEYRGKDYSGRLGNFYAHTLVFEPEALALCGYNPVALSRSSLFKTPIDEDCTMLDSLDSLDAAQSPETQPRQDWMAIVSSERYRASYASLLNALVQRLYVERPLILAFKQHEEAADYIEALLMLLPPAERGRITFTTYEPDPASLIRRGGSAPGDSLKVVTTIGQDMGGSFEFRPHEFTQFLIWDFNGERNSAFPPPSAYSEQMLNFCAGGQSGAVTDCQDFLMQLGAGNAPEVWDTLVQADQLKRKLDAPEKEQLAQHVLAALVKVVQTESETGKALPLVWNLLLRMAREEAALFPQAWNTFSVLFNRLPPTSALRLGTREQLIDLAGSFLAAHDVSRACLVSDIDQTAPQPILLDAAIRKEQQGWARLSASMAEPEFTDILRSLDALAEVPALLEWSIQRLWQAIKARPPLSEERFTQVVKRASALLQRLPTDEPLRKEIAEESFRSVQGLYLKGFPAHALTMLELSGRESKTALSHIYRELIAAGWPGDVRSPVDPRAREALQTTLEVTVQAMLSSEQADQFVLEQLLPAFQVAGRCGFANTLWLTNKERLIKLLRQQLDRPGALRFIESIWPILEESGSAEETFQLILLQMKLYPSDLLANWTLDQWADLEARLIRLAWRYPEARMTEAAALMQPYVTPSQRATVWRIALKGLALPLSTAPSELEAISQALHELAKSLISPGMGIEPDWDGLREVFLSAHLIQVALTLWRNIRKPLTEKVEKLDKSGVSRAVDWAAAVVSLLGKEHPDLAFELLCWQTENEVLSPFEDWQRRIEKLMRLAYSTPDPDGHIKNVLKLIGSPLEAREQAMLLALVYQHSGKLAGAREQIEARYTGLLKSLADPDDVWQVRAALAAGDNKALLVTDFAAALRENALSSWKEKILSQYPALALSISQQLASSLWEGQAVVESCLTYLALFNEQSLAQCAPLVSAFIASVPLKVVDSMWKPWFEQADSREQKRAGGSDRVKALVFIHRVQAARAAGKLGTQQALEYLNTWGKLRGRLGTQADEQWASTCLFALFREVDLSSSQRVQRFVEQCGRAYDQRGLQAALDTMPQSSGSDPLVLALGLVALGQQGIASVPTSEGEKLADMMAGGLGLLPSEQGELVWQHLAVWAAHRVPPASDAYQQFRRMTGPTARMSRSGRRLIQRLFKFGQSSLSTKRDPEEANDDHQ